MQAASDAPLPAAGAVLLTRPRRQSEAFAARLAQRGIDACVFPTLEIDGPADPAAFSAAVDATECYDTVVFISPTAVERGLPALRARDAHWPGAGTRVAAVGPGTRNALRAQGLDAVLAPIDGSGAAALLALPALLEPPPRSVLIVEGEHGRDELADGLAALGARVVRAGAYRRRRPDADAGALLARWRAGGISAVVVASVETLDNLIALLGATGLPWLRATPLYTHHARIAEAARARGIGHVVEAGPDEDALLAALVAARAA